MNLQNRPFNSDNLHYTTNRMKSIFFIILFFVFNYSFAVDTAQALKILANAGEWATYKPDNFDFVSKLGDAAFLWSTDANAESLDDQQLITRDPYIQFKPHAMVMAQRKTKSGIELYKKFYSFDAKGRRSIGMDIRPNRKNFIALGCSFTLGTGLNDNETFPYYFTLGHSRGLNVFNMGIYGAGANDILDDLKSFKRFEDIPKTGGIVLYTALYDHIERSLCTLNCYRNTYKGWVLKKSNYEYDSKNKTMVNKGSFADSRPIKGLLFNALASISLFDKLNIPPELTDSQIEQYVLMLVEMKKIVKEKIGADFYFTFYPGYYEYWDRIKAKLDKYQIKYFDLSDIDLKNVTDQRHAIILDGHPTKLASYLYANIIGKRLPQQSAAAGF